MGGGPLGDQFITKLPIADYVLHIPARQSLEKYDINRNDLICLFFQPSSVLSYNTPKIYYYITTNTRRNAAQATFCPRLRCSKHRGSYCRQWSACSPLSLTQANFCLDAESVNLNDVGRAYKRTEPEDVNLNEIGRAYKRTEAEDVNLNEAGRAYKRTEAEDVNLNEVGRAYRRNAPADVDLDAIGRAYKRTDAEDVNLDNIGRAYKRAKAEEVNLEAVGRAH